MSWLRCATMGLMALAGLVSAVAPVRAQEVGDPDNARIHVGSLALSPTIRLTNIGRDSNIFNDSDENNAKSDVTATASPALEAWFRAPRVRLNVRSQWDFFYFRELTSLRALDIDQSGRVEVILNRVMPFVAGNLSTTRHRQNLEIDAIARRRNDGLQVGTYVRLTAKTFVGLYAGRSHLKYESNALFRETNLARLLNHTGSHEGIAFRYQATPLTTFMVNVEQGRDRFEFSAERNSDSVRITPSVEFKPFALVSGHASLGFRRVSFRDSDQPQFKSTTASVDLQYRLRGRTLIGFGAQRDLEYSYVSTQRDYVLTGLNTSVTQRFGDNWDARGTVGRYRLNYRRREPQSLAVVTQALPSETVLSSGANIGYYIGRNRIGFAVQHLSRESDVAVGRGYERLRISSSLTYVF